MTPKELLQEAEKHLVLSISSLEKAQHWFQEERTSLAEMALVPIETQLVVLKQGRLHLGKIVKALEDEK